MDEEKEITESVDANDIDNILDFDDENISQESLINETFVNDSIDDEESNDEIDDASIDEEENEEFFDKDDIEEDEPIDDKPIEDDMHPEKKEIEVVSGDGNLDISPVYDHIDIERPDKDKEKKQIVIPEEKKKN